MRSRPSTPLPVAIFCVLFLLVITASAVPGLSRTPTADVASTLIYIAFFGSLLIRAVTESRHQRAWLLLGVGFVFNTVASVYDAAIASPESAAAFPTIADAGYLMTYPFALAAVAMLIRTEVGALPRMTWLDGAISLFGAAAVITSLTLGVLIETKDGNTLGVIVALTYPIGDALLVGMMVGFVALTTKRPSPMWATLLAGLLLFAIGDLLYLSSLSAGGDGANGWIDAIWMAGVTAMGIAAWVSDGTDAASPKQRSSLATIALPIAFAVLALLVITTGTFTEVHTGAVTLSGVTLGLVVIRTAFSFQQAQLLGAARGEARTDDLTGLANRRFFYEELARRVERTTENVSVIIFDLARFKEVNDAFGHESGDRILEAVGGRVSATLRDTDFLARLGSDEFALVLDGNTQTAERFARRLCEQFEQPFDIGHFTTVIDANFGISSYPEHSTSVDRLVQQADLATRLAKSERNRVRTYAPGEDVDLLERAETVHELQRDVSTDAMVLHFQPKLDVRSGRVTGVEALVRWEHPTRGLLYPDAFLELTEQSGLMQQLTRNVVSRSLRQANMWKSAGIEVKVSVNLSPSDLRAPGFAEWVSAELGANELDGSALQVELTEELLMSDPDLGRNVLTQLRDAGISISIDDFGTGYSSLAYLQHLPVDELKLDRSFVMQLDSSENSAPIVKSTIELAHSLGLSFVAEGVESQASLDLLTAWGCDVAQGYLIGRPGTVDQITSLLAVRHASVDA